MNRIAPLRQLVSQENGSVRPRLGCDRRTDRLDVTNVKISATRA
jgi:hypothetical protein